MGDSRDRPELSGTSNAGRVSHDDRGRNVWQWTDARVDIESTTILLRRLDNDALQLEPTLTVPIPKPPKRSPGTARQSKPGAAASASRNELTLSDSMRIEMGGGFDPYNRA
jgi:hypothetical protein